MFWEKFNELCNEKNDKPTPLVKKLGIAAGSVTRWKNGTVPNGVTLEKIANYFDVSVDYLLGKTETKKESGEYPALTEEQLALLFEIKSLPEDQQREAWDYIQYLKSKRQ